MFRTILVPVDLSDKHQPALKLAAELAGQGKGEITLIHVIEVMAGLAFDDERDFYDRLEKAARQHIDQLGSRLKAQNVRWRAEVVFGKRAPEIVRHARDHGADLIVLTIPRMDPDNLGATWGSLSHKISLWAPCPVLLVK